LTLRILHVTNVPVLFVTGEYHILDWARAIERNRDVLVGVVAVLFAMLERAGGLTVAALPRSVHSAVLRLLRPAESAVRRLVVIAARGLVVKPVPTPARAFPATPITRSSQSRPSFQLFDPRKNFAELRPATGPRILPRILFVGSDPRVAALWARPQLKAAPEPLPDGLVKAVRLGRRLQALKAALDDLPRQARRLARWRLRREKMPSPKFRSPLRPGRPPGYRRKATHDVDEVLIECHGLAVDALKPDTS
jgi:hypothetical protein